jgi:FUN14 domain-containing protein 1
MVENKKDPVEAAIDKLKPMLQQLSFGGVMGYCSGMALKKVGKALAFVVGVGFVGLQLTVSAGYIDVDWGKIKDDALKPLDSVRRKKKIRTRTSIYV